MAKRYHIKVRNIVMGVPITFLYKYNPDQFEIVSFRKGDNGEDLIFSKKKRTSSTVLSSHCTTSIAGDQEQGRIDKWETYIRENNNKKGGLIREPIDCFHVLLTNGNCASHGKEVRRIENESPCINGKWLYTRITIRKKPKHK